MSRAQSTTRLLPIKIEIQSPDQTLPRTSSKYGYVVDKDVKQLFIMDFEAVCRTCLGTKSLNPIFKSKEHHDRFSMAMINTTGLKVKLFKMILLFIHKYSLQHSFWYIQIKIMFVYERWFLESFYHTASSIINHKQGPSTRTLGLCLGLGGTREKRLNCFFSALLSTPQPDTDLTQGDQKKTSTMTNELVYE